MNIPDMPVQVPVDDPNADTEWNDILRKHKIIPEKPPSPTPMIEEALQEGRRLAHENRLESKDLDELAALEDEEDEEFLESYRRTDRLRATCDDIDGNRLKRMTELATITAASVFNQVYQLQKPDYSSDVTEASNKAYVLVLLTSSHGTNTESRVLIEIWRDLARRFGDVKFCQIQGDLCIEGYPERNTPTILIYKDGDIKKQLVTLKDLKGPRTSTGDLERLLVEIGAVNPSDSRLQNRPGAESAQNDYPRSSIRHGTIGKDQDDEDSDWD
ncbi:thioredoxin-like protein [Pseudovirgaria hyperparasitica]|uniref:Thioredoxin-like protein n=1 Tax=Pseudovirgaria hyperparasitica TaxID=470096 RepID=A0A6A6W3B9_9PEZI|nr:thioredoxin-like protein [Pseudovirgaria hyperparasitica]KAF2757352.1 thioredoxin-like protein [Pseudovirgaria hyperparasitica]